MGGGGGGGSPFYALAPCLKSLFILYISRPHILENFKVANEDLPSTSEAPAPSQVIPQHLVTFQGSISPRQAQVCWIFLSLYSKPFLFSKS